MSKDNETGGSEIQTFQYNKLRAEEYLHLYKRFYAKYPLKHDCDFTLEDVVFDKLESLEFNLKTEELAHQETLKVWRELKKALDYATDFIDGYGVARIKEGLGREGMDAVLEEINKIIEPTKTRV